MRKALALLWLLFPCLLAGQAYTTITATNVTVDNGSGTAVNPPSGSQLCFLGVNNAGAAITYTPSGGSPVSGTVCGTLNGSGGLTGSLQVANPATASPLGLLYTITVVNSPTTYLTIPTVSLSGTVWSFDSYGLPGTGTALGVGKAHIACAGGAQWTSTTLPPGLGAQLCNSAGQWTSYPPAPYCPAGQAYLVPQTGGMPMCISPSFEGIGAPSGACTEKATYLDITSTNFYACKNGTWGLIGSGGSGVSLTTNKFGGASTLSGGVLNVPQYQGFAPSQAQWYGLVGAFTDSLGNVIEPIWIGKGPTTFAPPVGATQLQLGVNDDLMSDNTGSWVISVNGTNYTVQGSANAWVSTGGINSSYPVTTIGGTSPTVVTGISFPVPVTISYVSGTVASSSGIACTGGSSSPWDAAGEYGCYFTGISPNTSAYGFGHWALASPSISPNPMTSPGDLAVGGVNGYPTRLPAGSGYLHWNGSAFVYDTPTSGFTAGGDLSGSSTSQQVIGLQGKSLPSPSLGYLFDNGSTLSWTGLPTGIVTSSASITAGCGQWIRATSTSAVTLALPSVTAAIGTCSIVFERGVSAAALTTVAPGSGTYDGASSNLQQAQAMTIWNDGTNWHSSSPIVPGSNCTWTPNLAGNVLNCSGGGGGGGGQPGSCTASVGNQLCLTDTTYNASTQGNITTTVTATWSPGTSGTVGSCSTFLANQGVSIVGAGTAGARYTGTVVSCTSGNMVVNPATTTTVSSGGSCTLGSETAGCVEHDESAAFNAAMNYFTTNGSGNVWLNDGVYMLNGPLLDTSGANAVVKLPVILYPGTGYIVGIQGFTDVHGQAINETKTGAILLSGITSGKVIAGYDAASSGFGPFSNVRLMLRNLFIDTPATTWPNVTLVGLKWVASFDIQHIQIGTLNGTCTAGGTGVGIETPSLSSDSWNVMDDVGIACGGTGAILGEHDNVGSIFLANLTNGIVPDVRTGSTGNSIHVGYMWGQLVANSIAAGTEPTTINVDNADFEVTTSHGVNDPSNLLTGYVHWKVPYTDGRSPLTLSNPQLNGATNLCVISLLNPTVSQGPCQLNLFGGALGSTPYQTAANTTALLAGNTTTAKEFYTQTGTGSASAAPAWAAIASADLAAALTAPPPIGATTPNTGGFSSLKDTGAASGSGENCLQVDTAGNISNTGSACGSGGGSSGGLFNQVMSTTPTITSLGMSTNYNQQGTYSTTNVSTGVTLNDSADFGNSDNIEGILKAYPGSAFTFTVLISSSGTIDSTNGGNSSLVGIAVAASTSGHVSTCDYDGTNATNATVFNYELGFTNWNSPTSFNARPSSMASWSTYGQIPTWLRWKDDGTNYYCQWSTDGVNFQTLNSGTKSGSFVGTYTYIGLVINPHNTKNLTATILSAQ